MVEHHFFVSSACNCTYLKMTRNGWAETRCLKVCSTSAWVWFVGSVPRGVLPWETTPLLSQSTMTRGISPWYADAAAFRISCIITPPRISRGMRQHMTNIQPMYTCTALWKLCIISLLPRSRCQVILPSFMAYHVLSPGIVLSCCRVPKSCLRCNWAILTRSDLKNVSSCAQIKTRVGREQILEWKIVKGHDRLWRSGTCILM